MKAIHWRFAIFLLTSPCVVFPAKVYKCVDAEGETVYQQRPCTPGRDQTEIGLPASRSGEPADFSERIYHACMHEEVEKLKLEQTENPEYVADVACMFAGRNCRKDPEGVVFKKAIRMYGQGGRLEGPTE